MFQTNPNNTNNDNEDATRPVVARATHLAKLTTYPDFIDAAADIDMDIYPLYSCATKATTNNMCEEFYCILKLIAI